MNKKYGWIPDIPDIRDIKFELPSKFSGKLPSFVDLSPLCPEIWNQLSLCSCTSHGIGACFEFIQMKIDPKKAFMPSRLFIYYNERAMEGTVNQDAGAMIRDGIKSIVKQGVCPEKDWIYDIENFTVKPGSFCYSEALKNQAISYQRLSHDLVEMKSCLADGYPFIVGFTVYSGFESDEVARTGIGNLPAKDETVQGGHCVLCVGYDDDKQRFIFRNSWGSSWGNKGYFTLPYEYLTNSNLSDDFWTLRLVEMNEVESPISQSWLEKIKTFFKNIF